MSLGRIAVLVFAVSVVSASTLASDKKPHLPIRKLSPEALAVVGAFSVNSSGEVREQVLWNFMVKRLHTERLELLLAAGPGQTASFARDIAKVVASSPLLRWLNETEVILVAQHKTTNFIGRADFIGTISSFAPTVSSTLSPHAARQ